MADLAELSGELFSDVSVSDLTPPCFQSAVASIGVEDSIAQGLDAIAPQGVEDQFYEGEGPQRLVNWWFFKSFFGLFQVFQCF